MQIELFKSENNKELSQRDTENHGEPQRFSSVRLCDTSV